MNHFVCLSASVAAGASYQQLNAVTDQATNIFNNRYTFSEDRRIGASFVLGNGITLARITTPTLRLISYPAINPLQSAATPGNLPPINFYGDNGPAILKNDELAVEATNPTGAAVTAYAGLWTQRERRSAPGGMNTAVRCSATITQSAGAWVAGPVTFEQQLPSGRYAVTGFSVVAANALFARLIFPQQPDRPGVVCQQAAGEYDWPIFRNGGMGWLGEFYTYAPPQLEIFATGAGASQDLFMDVIKVG